VRHVALELAATPFEGLDLALLSLDLARLVASGLVRFGP
jgi:hypothetical protein